MKHTGWALAATLLLGPALLQAQTQGPPLVVDFLPPAIFPNAATLPAPAASVDATVSDLPGSQPAGSSIPPPAKLIAPGVGGKGGYNDSPTEWFAMSPFWIDADYILFYIRNTPNGVPLLSRADSLAIIPGVPPLAARGNPNTDILFGGTDRNRSIGGFSGARLTMGLWLDGDEDCGIQASGFRTEQRSQFIIITKAAAPLTGVLARPFSDATNPAGESALYLAFPGALDGDFQYTNRARLGGYDINALFNFRQAAGFRIDGLLGYRYFDFREDLALQTNSGPVAGGPPATFLGEPITFPNILTVTDTIKTANQFYGGMAGFSMQTHYDRVFVRFRGDVSLGVTQERLDINGTTASTLPFGSFSTPRTVEGGFFAQDTNIRRETRNMFCVLPSIDFRVGYQLSQWCSVHAGYTFMLLSQTLRPGDQIDPNPTLASQKIPSSPNFGLGTGGDSSPMPIFHSASFWTQGLDVGLTFSY